MVKKYEEDEIKDRARQEIYRFADESLPQDRTNSSAIYLSSDNEKESLLLDKLGIPRGHRIILEKDKDKIARVRKNNPEVGVIPVSTHEFFLTEAKNYPPFWYCGLDYECMLNSAVLADIANISQNRNLLDGGVLYTNLVGTHEQTTKKEEYSHYFFKWVPSKRRIKEVFGPNFNFEKEADKMLEQMIEEFTIDIPKGSTITSEQMDYMTVLVEEKLVKDLPEGKLSLLRSYAISQALKSHMRQESINPLMFDNFIVPGSDRVVKKYLKENPERMEEIDDLKEYLKEFEFSVPFVGQKFSTLLDMLTESRDRNLHAIRPQALKIERNAIRFFRENGFNSLPFVFIDSETEGYVPINNEIFSYISSRNTQMMLNLTQVRQINPQTKSTLDRLIEEDVHLFYTEKKLYLGKPWKGLGNSSMRTIIKRISEQSREIKKELEREVGFLKYMDEVVEDGIPHNRINLGSGFLQPLTLGIARNCILDGMTNEEISEKYQVRNWRRIAALRANLTRDRIKKPKETVLRKNERISLKLKKPEDNFSKHLIPRRKYRELTDECKMRLNYFVDEVLEPLHWKKKRNIRQSFSDSDLGKLIDPEINPIRFYAFFDDIGLSIMRNERVTSEFINRTYKNIQNSESLVNRVSREERINSEKKPKNIGKVSEKVKSEVRALIDEGLPKEEIWEAYKDNFSSRKQFGSVIAWASPNLSSKRKK